MYVHNFTMYKKVHLFTNTFLQRILTYLICITYHISFRRNFWKKCASESHIYERNIMSVGATDETSAANTVTYEHGYSKNIIRSLYVLTECVTRSLVLFIRSINLHYLFSRLVIRSLYLHNSFSRIAIIYNI